MRPSPSTPSSHDRATGARASPVVVARAPTRIDFGGGWTDVPPYPERDGGFVCNLAITRYATVRLDARIGGDSEPLASAALRRAGIGGHARIANDFPVGAGLGGSSAAGVALQAAIARMRGIDAGAELLVRRSRAVEVEELGVAGGWQDHYAAAHGGALALDLGGTTTVTRIALPPGAAESLRRRALLLYTGETRISGANITAVLDAYTARESRVVTALARMAHLARDMAVALAGGDLDTLGALVGEHWVLQRTLHPAITTARIDEIVERARAAGALGTKALGASGGGCVVIITGPDPAPVRRAVEPLGTILTFDVATVGATAAGEP